MEWRSLNSTTEIELLADMFDTWDQFNFAESSEFTNEDIEDYNNLTTDEFLTACDAAQSDADFWKEAF